MSRERHHVVSRGYLRLFADGERVCLVDKTTRTFRRFTSTRGVFVESQFNSTRTSAGWDDSLEDGWQNIEAIVLPRVRRLMQRAAEEEDREAALVLAAVHFARSYALREAQGRIALEVVRERAPLLERDPNLLAIFENEKGRPPVSGEIGRAVQNSMALMTNQRTIHIDGMVRAYEFALKRFLPSQAQLLYTSGAVGLVTGDTPLVFSDSSLMRLGTRGGVALGDAEVVYMPLARNVGMMLWSKEPPPDVDLTPADAQRLNWLVWRSARRFLVCHPSADPSRLLGSTVSENAQRSVDQAVAS